MYFKAKDWSVDVPGIDLGWKIYSESGLAFDDVSDAVGDVINLVRRQSSKVDATRWRQHVDVVLPHQLVALNGDQM